jgi:hypothetical protein
LTLVGLFPILNKGVERSGVDALRAVAQSAVPSPAGARSTIMDYSQIYVVFSISVGLLQLFDSFLLRQSGGHLTVPNGVISGIELVWVVVSIAVLLSVDGVPHFMPLSYIVFSVAGSLLGFYLYRDLEIKEGRILPEDMVVPTWLIVGNGVFGVYFATVSFLVHQAMVR